MKKIKREGVEYVSIDELVNQWRKKDGAVICYRPPEGALEGNLYKLTLTENRTRTKFNFVSIKGGQVLNMDTYENNIEDLLRKVYKDGIIAFDTIQEYGEYLAKSEIK